MSFAYYYGMEAEQYAFFRIPKLLITAPQFKSLSTDAKLLYGLMLDRMSLSVKSGWLDDDGRVYIYYTLEDIDEQLGFKKDKAVKLLAELDTGKGIGLIERVKQGQGRPTRIYVKRFFEATEVQTSEKPKSRVLENRSLEVGKTDSKTSEKTKSRLRNSRSAEVGKTDPNNTYVNKTDFIKTNLSIYPASETRDVIDVDRLREETKERLEYPHLVSQYGCEDIDGIVELIVETLSRPGETIRISGADFSAELVKERFRGIGPPHVEYVLDCLKQNTTKVYNIKAYLLTALYNSVTTIGPYYQAEVNHDFYRKE